MGYRVWTDKDLEIAVKSSTTKSEVIRKLGLTTKSSGNFQTIDKYIRSLGLDISHFKEANGNPPNKEWDIEDILIENSPYTNTASLKRKLIKLRLLKNECYGQECGITEWYGKKLSLQLDHINGDRTDNRIENLRLLCPNCHSLTPTFCRGKSPRKEFRCPDCNVVVKKQFARCQKCAGLVRRNINQKINWPDIDTVFNQALEVGHVKTGKTLGVSDNAVRKRIDMNVNVNDDDVLKISKAWKNLNYHVIKMGLHYFKTTDGISVRVYDRATKLLILSPTENYLSDDLIPNEWEGFTVLKKQVPKDWYLGNYNSTIPDFQEEDK